MEPAVRNFETLSKPGKLVASAGALWLKYEESHLEITKIGLAIQENSKIFEAHHCIPTSHS